MTDAPDRERRLHDAMAAFVAALDRGESPDRDAILDADPDLDADLREFFSAHDELAHLAEPLRAVARAAVDVGDPSASTLPLDGQPSPPDVGGHVRYFGDYELLAEIARGGMGVVYRARQVSLNRPVALKMILAGDYATEADVARFRAEAEAVANLDHPHIVPIHEVGTHAGFSYFSMKLLDGGSLADHLPRFAADPRAAASLLSTIARAVHHAHRRGILHRDLKPSNILLDLDGRPHVADFGLARRLDGAGDLTSSGALVGSPSYMAPEQAHGSRRGTITVATDVYGLGAILYALLASRAPFKADSVLETVDLVKTRPPEPLRPLNAKVDRDLEIICLKCLEKDPSRRYDSASSLADDLDRYLRGEPIQARPVRRVVRAWMWCRRNPAVAGLAAALVVSVVGGLAATTWKWRETVWQRDLLANSRAEVDRQRNVAVAARDEALAINDFLVNDLLSQADPEKNRRADAITVEQAVDRAAGRVERAFRGRPRVEYEVRWSIANVYHSLGEHTKAEAQYRKLLEIRSRQHTSGDRGEFVLARQLAHVLGHQDRFQEAEPLARRAYEGLVRLEGPDDEQTLIALDVLTYILFKERKLEEADRLSERLVEATTRILGPRRRATLLALRNAACHARDRGKYAGAEALLRRVLKASEEVNGPDDPTTLWILREWIVSLQKLGRPAEAEAPARRLLEVSRSLYGPEHQETRTTTYVLGQVLDEAGKPAVAEPVFRGLLEQNRRLDGPGRRSTLMTQQALAAVLARLGRDDEAEALYRESVDGLRRALGPDDDSTLFAANGLAVMLNNRGKLAEAEALFRPLSEASDRVRGPDHPDSLAVTANLAFVLRERGRLAEAEPLFRRALEGLTRTAGAGHPNTLTTMANLALLLKARGKLDEAESLTRRSVAGFERVLGTGAPMTSLVTGSLAALLHQRGKLAEAERLARRAAKSTDRAFGAEHDETLKVKYLLALLLQDRGKLDEAESILRPVVEARSRLQGPEHPETIVAAYSLGVVILMQGRPADAEPVFRRVVQARRVAMPGDWIMADAEGLLGECLLKLGRLDEAERLLVRNYSVLSSAPGRGPAQVRYALNRLVALAEARGRRDEADRWRARRLDLGFPADPFARR